MRPVRQSLHQESSDGSQASMAKVELRSIEAMMKPYGMLYKAARGSACGPDNGIRALMGMAIKWGQLRASPSLAAPIRAAALVVPALAQPGCHSPGCARLGPPTPAPRLPTHIA